jgi:hypothetical protein
MWLDTSVSENQAACIFRVKWSSRQHGPPVSVLWVLLSYNNTTQCHNSEDHDLNFEKYFNTLCLITFLTVAVKPVYLITCSRDMQQRACRKRGSVPRPRGYINTTVHNIVSICEILTLVTVINIQVRTKSRYSLLSVNLFFLAWVVL